MKVLHVPFGFYPDSVGGTEVYVENLCGELQGLNIDILIAAPSDNNTEYTHNGIKVQRYAMSQATSIREIYGAGNPTSSTNFALLLEAEKPDVVHLHALTRAVSVSLVEIAHKKGIPVIFTYHTPTVSCIRGTLLRWGSKICDGILDVKLCTHCQLQNLGISKPIGAMLKHLPPTFGAQLGDYGFSGGAWTALRMTELVALRHSTTLDLMHKVDGVVVLCNWVKDLLIRNHVPEDKMILSRHGLSNIPFLGNSEHALSASFKPIKLIYLGRLDPTKGIDMVIQAIRSLSEFDIKLDIYGIHQSGSENYYQSLLKLANQDNRICFLPKIPQEQIMTHLKQYHALVVPSRTLETGPLVVLEAFAAGTPVIGSNLGGIAEIVEHGKNGLLVDGLSPTAWQHTLLQLLMAPERLSHLRNGIMPPKSMADVAHEMLHIYQTVLSSKNMSI